MKARIAIKSLKNNDYFHKKATEIFDEIEYVENRPSPAEMTTFLSDIDVAIIGAREKISRQNYSAAKNPPHIIGTLSIGLDHIDIDYLDSVGVKVLNSPNANVISVAEHIFAFLLYMTKNLGKCDIASHKDLGRAGVKPTPIELAGKTLGLIGFGKIAKQVSNIAKSFSLNIVATSKTITSGTNDSITFLQLDDLLHVSDFISISVPFNDDTYHILGMESLEKLKKGVFIINTSRTEVVDHHSIKIGLNRQVIAGYAEDSDEMPSFLKHQPNVIWSPHLAGMTNEASDRLDNELIDNFSDYFSNRKR